MRSIISSGQARSGSVLIVMMGISLILIGILLTMSVKIKKSLADANFMTKHAQAYLMFQAATLYCTDWDKTNLPANRKSPESTTANRSGFYMLGGRCPTLASTFKLADNLGWYYVYNVVPNAADKMATPTAPFATYCIVAAGGNSQGPGAAKFSARKGYDVRYYFTDQPTMKNISQPGWPTTLTSWPSPSSSPQAAFLWP